MFSHEELHFQFISIEYDRPTVLKARDADDLRYLYGINILLFNTRFYLIENVLKL